MTTNQTIKGVPRALLERAASAIEKHHGSLQWVIASELRALLDKTDTDISASTGMLMTGRRPIPAGIESLAQQIYQSWESQPGFVPWVDGGNSLKQDEARQIASRTFELALANQVGDLP